MKKRMLHITKDVPKTVWIAAAVCAASLVLLIVCSILAANQPPKFIPPQFDPAAEHGVPELGPEQGWGEIWQPGMEFKAGVCGHFTVEDGCAQVYFANLEGKAWLKLRILDADNNVIGETGLLRPGEYLRSAVLTAIPAAGDSVTMKIMAYEPETYYSLGSVLLSTVMASEGGQG